MIKVNPLLVNEAPGADGITKTKQSRQHLFAYSMDHILLSPVV